MAGITLAQAETRLAEYMSAESKVLKGQVVTLEGESLTRADLDIIQRGIDTWNRRVKDLSASTSGTSRARTVAPAW